ncbi:HAD family hydrolase [Streptomyces sp. NBC_01262]|uniref:HAD family hydrolase n=1 Tax=Streptomyces sp. NBC_01262 TaxID=2903803 RepID=UPI002E3556F9|nr:HAD family hydrolase [Streptomyces sp. NBC_01262]
MSQGFHPYGLIATDLDGTLLGSDHQVSPRNREALAAATAAGAAHIVVTGRPASRTLHVFEALGYEGLAVCGQGSEVYHAGERRLLTSVTLDRSSAQLALAKIEAETGPLRLGFVRDGLDGAYLAGPGFQLAWDKPIDGRMTSRDELWAEPLAKIFVQHGDPGVGEDELAAIARAAAGDLVGIVVSGIGIVELLPLGLTKATGLSLAARRLGFKAADTIAFGDMPNDIPMFGWAAYGVAMANAHDELKAVADEVTASNDEDGIAEVLERLLAGPAA